MEAKWLIIGNDTYDDSLIDNVPAVKDSMDLLEASIKGAYKEGVTVIRKENLNNTAFLNSITDFFSSVDEDTLPFFYFCGHGYRRQNHLFLAASDSVPNGIEHSSVEYKYILDRLRERQIKHAVIVLDCCYSGAANGLAITDEFKPVLSEDDYPNIVCLTSCKGVEKSYFIENNGLEYAAFTYHFAMTMTVGVSNKRHRMSLGEVYDTIKGKIKNQKPTISSTGRFDEQRIIPNVKYRTVHSKEMHVPATKTKLKVLFVKSSIRYPIKDDGDFGVPLGLWLLKSYINRTTTDIVVDIFDERLRELQGNTESFEECASKYDVIGTSMCSCEVPPSIEKMRIAKCLGKITVAGGIFTYSNEEYLLSYPFVDFVVPGVGTLPLARLFNELRKRKEHSDLSEIIKYINETHFDCFGLQNVFSRGNIKDAVMWEAASMPHIEFDIWDEIIQEYGPYIHDKIDIFTSRGCNKSCSFCSVQRETKHNVIKCDIDHIVRTIDYLYNKGMRKFSVKDEDFFIDGNSRLENILENFKEYDDISFKIRARIDTMLESHQSAEDLAKFHVCEVQYGVESPNNDLRKQVQKSIGESTEDVINLFHSHYEHGIVVNASFILGLPGEDNNYYAALIDFIKHIYEPGMTKVYLNFFTPHPVKCKIPDDVFLVSNDLHYYTHKIPVCYSKTPRAKVYARRKMLDTYDKIVELTSSQDYNPTIPDQIRESYISDHYLENYEIMKYGEESQ